MRARNASQRRKVLATLAKVKRDVSALANHWDVPSTVYVSPAERPAGTNAYRRDRRPEEYPEEQAASWAYLYNASDEMISTLTALRETARVRYYEIKDAEYYEIKDAEADRSAGDA